MKLKQIIVKLGKSKTNPIAKMMGTKDGRSAYGHKIEKSKKGKGSYNRRDKHKKSPE